MSTTAGHPAPDLTLAERLASGPVVLDGGLATLLEAHGHDLTSALWSARLLLDDPGAVAILEGLKGRGIPVHVSAASLVHGGQESAGFDLVSDEGWQKLLARGGVTVL